MDDCRQLTHEEQRIVEQFLDGRRRYCMHSSVFVSRCIQGKGASALPYAQLCTWMQPSSRFMFCMRNVRDRVFDYSCLCVFRRHFERMDDIRKDFACERAARIVVSAQRFRVRCLRPSRNGEQVEAYITYWRPSEDGVGLLKVRVNCFRVHCQSSSLSRIQVLRYTENGKFLHHVRN